jgi:formamidopyrimidine-DNA glycosylase
LRKKIIGKKIKNFETLYPKVAAGKPNETAVFLVGKTIAEIDRRGKLMIVRFKKNDEVLLVHLKMTGQLIYVFKKTIIGGGHSFKTLNTQLPDKYTGAIFTFSDGSKLFFNDLRKFGYLKLADTAQLKKVLAGFGIEPLTHEFTYGAFSVLIKTKKMNIKTLLLNQALVAGVGNIYADEICHAAGVLPMRRTQTLTKDEIKKLYQATNAIIKKAIHYRGTTFNNYVDSDGRTGNFVRFLKVYERDGERCLACKKGLIHKKKIAGRGTHFCPHCQK